MKAERTMTPDVFVARCKAVYDETSVRQALQNVWRQMGRDAENPFREQLSTGGMAVIKPNWVLDFNRGGGGTDCLVTHATLIACCMDWCAKAMNGRGVVVVGDAPVQLCRFDSLLAQIGFHEVVASLQTSHPNVDFQVQDWRLTVLPRRTASGGRDVLEGQEYRDAHPSVHENYFETDLGTESFLEDIVDYADRFRVTMYPPSLLKSHHRRGTHQYLVRNEPLRADLFINLAKMKTHKKAGLTGALKNLVGINGHKEYLPHHVQGSYFDGGDAYCRKNYFAALADNIYDDLWENRNSLSRWGRWRREKWFRAVWIAARLTGSGHYDPGSWCGNETIWRTTLDLNHLLYFGERRPKHILNIADGVVAGEGEGPLSPQPKPLGMIVVGENPAHVDAVLATVMGYNVARIPTVYNAVYHRKSKFGGTDVRDIPIRFADEHPRSGSPSDLPVAGFAPPSQWRRAMSASTAAPRAPFHRGGPCCCQRKDDPDE